MKLIDIINEDNFKHHSSYAEKDADTLVTKGFRRGADTYNKETGKTSTEVINATNFKKAVGLLYKVYDEIDKYRTVSYPKVNLLAKAILRDVTQTIKDIKSLEDYTEIVKQGLR